jgi:hypothetical protein
MCRLLEKGYQFNHRKGADSTKLSGLLTVVLFADLVAHIAPLTGSSLENVRGNRRCLMAPR